MTEARRGANNRELGAPAYPAEVAGSSLPGELFPQSAPPPPPEGVQEAGARPTGKRPPGPRPPTKKQAALFRSIVADECFTPAERDQHLKWLREKATSKTCMRVIDWAKRERFRRTGNESPRTQEL